MKLKTCWNALSADYIDQHVRNDNNVERKVFNWYICSYINNENIVSKCNCLANMEGLEIMLNELNM